MPVKNKTKLKVPILSSPNGTHPLAFLLSTRSKMNIIMPAFQEGIKQDSAEIAAIIANTAEPAFENTILPLDKSGDLLEQSQKCFFQSQRCQYQ